MKRGNFMTNTQRYLNSIKGFRKDLQEVNDKFRPEYERLERFKDSGSYAQSKKLLDDRRNAEVEALRREYADRLKSAVDAMEKAYMNRPTSAPTQEQLSVLQALKLRDRVSRDELRRAAQTMRGCPVAERALELLESGVMKADDFAALAERYSENPTMLRLVALHARKGMYAAAGAPMSAERDALAGVVELCNRRLTAELDSFDRLTAKLSAEGSPEC